MQWTSKKFTENRDTHAELLFCFTIFSAFDWDQQAKIRYARQKERLKICEDAKSDHDLLKTDEEIQL